MNVVIEPPPRHEDREIRGNLLTSQTGDKCGKMVSVAADVTKASCRPAVRRVSAPFRLLLAGELERRGEPVLGIFHLHDAHLAYFAGSNHLASLPYHRIASVVVSKAEDHPRTFDRFGEVKRGRKRGRDRFIADDVKAGFDKGLSRRMVSEIRGDDCDGIDAVGLGSRPPPFPRNSRMPDRG